MISGSIDLSFMESRLVNRGLDFTRKKKKWILLIGLIGFSSYGVYKVYNLPSVARKRRRFMKLFESLVSMAEMVSDSAETITVISREMKEFLMSDSDEIPNSVKQLSKIARSEEFSESVIRVCQAMTIGIQRGCYCSVESNGNEIREVGKDESSFTERVMDKLMTSAGTGFVSVIVGSFARNLVLGFYASSNDGVKSSSSELPSWMNLVLDDKGRVVVADCIKTFVSTAVGVYLDKTMDVNVYDEMFSGLTNPKHQKEMSGILVSLCNGAVETLVKTSHHVLTDSKRESSDSSHVSSLEKNGIEEMPGNIDLQNNGWVSSVSSTLAVPSNRKFVLDVTGRVTFETVKSVIEFSSRKVSQGLKTSMSVVRDEVVERGFQVVRYIGAKSYVILTICLALFLHILGNTRVLLPA